MDPNSQAIDPTQRRMEAQLPKPAVQRVNLQLAERIVRAKERPDGLPRVELR